MCIFSADSLKRIWEFLRRNSLKNINPRNSGEKYSHHRPTLSFRYLIVLVSGIFIFAYFLPSAEYFLCRSGGFFSKKAQIGNLFPLFWYTVIKSRRRADISEGCEMRRQRGCGCNKGLMGLTFACGLLISCFCPPKFLVAVLAIWVIILGFSGRRCWLFSREVFFVKVVLFKSPKFLSGILRVLFGIKKQNG